MKRLQYDYWVGLDAGLHEISICLIDDSGGLIFEGVRASDPGAILDILRVCGVERVRRIAIEAGVGTHVVRALRERGLPIKAIDTRIARKFLAIRRNKTDKNDARGLAELARFDGSVTSGTYLRPLTHQEIQIQLNIRRNLVVSRVRTDGLIRSVLMLYGMPFSASTRSVDAGKEAIRTLDELCFETTARKADLMPLLQTSDYLRLRISEIDKALRSLSKSIEPCALFQTMPGIGHLTALSYYATVCDPWRFPRNRDVGSYIGLTPTIFQSGTTKRTGRVGRYGNKMLRGNLAMAATVLLTKSSEPSQLQSWGMALRSRIGFTKARIAVARKMAVTLLSMWKSGEAFNPSYRGPEILRPGGCGVGLSSYIWDHDPALGK